MKIIILDGFHKGHALDWASPKPTIKLLKPPTVTVCDYDDEKTKSGADEIEYKLAFKSVDDKIALYSTTGSSEDFIRGLGRMVFSKPWNKEEELILGCHDARAFS